MNRLPKHRFTEYSKSLVNAQTLIKRGKNPDECKDMNVNSILKDKKLDMLKPNFEPVLRSKSQITFPMCRRPEIFPVKIEH
jgi:hypothetical protein